MSGLIKTYLFVVPHQVSQQPKRIVILFEDDPGERRVQGERITLALGRRREFIHEDALLIWIETKYVDDLAAGFCVPLDVDGWLFPAIVYCCFDFFDFEAGPRD